MSYKEIKSHHQNDNNTCGLMSREMFQFHRDRSELLKLVDEVLHEAATIIYLNDNSDYLSALWTIVRMISLETTEQLEKDAYRP